MTVRVLLVEDCPADAGLTREGLLTAPCGTQFEITQAETLKGAQGRLVKQCFDAILLDLGLPDSVGLDSLTQLREMATDVPIVVLSGQRDAMLAVEAVRRGAQDYLIKGLGEKDHLSRSILFAVERKRSEQHINRLANYDGLTNVPNRRLLQDRLKLALARARRNKGYLAVLYLDLDFFKRINDTLGHAVGDLVLQEVGRRLTGCARESDTVARLGGDEFALVISEITHIEDVGTLARKILDMLEPPFVLEGHELRVTASIGISLFPGDGKDAGTLLNNADVAMYGAKNQGRNSYQFFSPTMNARVHERLKLATGLRRALDQGELLLDFLPMVSLKSGRTIGVEALVRWQSPVWGLLAPGEFIPLAEETGLIERLEEWVIGEGCRQVIAWSRRGSRRLRLSVNLSSRHLGRGSAGGVVASALTRSGMEPGDLELDLAEAGLMQSGERGRQALEKLRGTGVRIAIDDFGTACSLAQLKHYPVNTLKIDRPFIKDVTSDTGEAVIYTALISMAHGLGLEVSAEGVERKDQVSFLRERHCDHAQGFYFGCGLSAASMEARLQSERDSDRQVARA